jgi:hypothetical protein
MKLSKFTCATFALLLFPLSGWASEKMSANIQIYQTVRIGSTELAPGEYKMTWTQSGSNVDVTFSQAKRVIATVPAQATQERSGYHSPALRIESVSNTLIGVDFPKVSISLISENAAPTNPGN